MIAPEVDVDLGPMSLADAKALHLALRLAINDSYGFEPETYSSLIAVKSMLNYKIEKAEFVSAFLCEPS